MPNPSNPTTQPPRAEQLPAQPTPKPNNKPIQQAYTNEAIQYPTYGVEVSDVHLRLGKTLAEPSSPQITKMVDEEPIAKAPDNSPLEPESN